MLVIESTILVVRIFAFILEHALDCVLHTPLLGNGDKIIQYYIFDASLEVLEEIAGVCSLWNIPCTLR